MSNLQPLGVLNGGKVIGWSDRNKKGSKITIMVGDKLAVEETTE